MATDLEALELVRLRKERDLCLGLLNLNREQDPEAFLKNALELIVEISGAESGFLEIFEAPGATQGWSHAVGDANTEGVRELVSRGIIAEAVASERVVVTPSALLDPRFRDRASVQRSNIDAVLCAPIGRDPPCGVLYLQSGRGAAAFPRDDVAEVELFADQLAPLVHQLLFRRRGAADDPTAAIRQKLKADEIVGRSKALARLLREVAAVAPLDVGVLLQGDTGTGKSQLARLIHCNGARAGGPFVELNCGALPENLIESELFGALPGAHSTASRRIEGKVQVAQGGTLLLDEVAELPLGAQAKLLQLLQTKEYYPLGAGRALTANVRVIAATNVDLRQAVTERRFREDLFYRLDVVTIRLPSMAERPEDAPLLALHFAERASAEHKLPRMALSPAALRAVENSEWRGNVRELAHTVERAVIRAASEGRTRIEVAELFPVDIAHGSKGSCTFQEETRRFQEQLVRKALDGSDWNVSAAARRLDITRAHVYNLIKSYGLTRQR